MTRIPRWLLLLVVIEALACSEGSGGGESAAVARGRGVYQNVCTACHHSDPSREGSLGPAVAGSSRELLEAKLLRGEYPDGYTPKRETMAMPRFPYLKDQIGDLAAYLAQAAAASRAERGAQ